MEAIYSALNEGDTTEFERLLKAYPECRYDDDGGDQWVTSAAMQGQLGVIELLVSFGADVAAPSDTSDASPPPEGPVFWAAAGGHYKVVEYMLDLGAPVNHDVRGQTRCFAMTSAAGRGYLEVVKLLVDRGAALNCAWANKTPLDHALECGRGEVAAYLRSVGGKTAAELT